tara:strand:+ start:310 stop:639 length:330 start_codon:yes stop_codon:yes gene_type:complete
MSSDSDKFLKTISEVSKELNIPQHVLRFWETKFTNLNPIQKSNGRRYYRLEDINLIKKIIDLLYNQRYSISGAQKKLKDKAINPESKINLILQLEEIKKKLSDVINNGA